MTVPVIFIHDKSHMTDSGSNSSLRGEVPSNNRLSHGKSLKHGGEYVKVKVKITLEQATKAQWGSEGIALLVL